MKKAVLVLLLIFILSQLTACGQREDSREDAPEETPSEPVTLNVCVDRRDVGGTYVANQLLSTPGRDTEFTILTETIPEEGGQRENVMTRIRTEILAGNGPDVFLCDTTLRYYDDGVLFPFPRQVMENRVFLPLDGYIEGAEYMEWDRFLPQVMEAGKNGDGQQLLPLGYEIRMFVLDKSLGEPQFEYPTDWETMAASDSPQAREIAGTVPFYNLLGEFADYDKDELALTEDEFFEYTRKNIAAFKASVGLESDMILAYVTDGSFHVAGESLEKLDLSEGGGEYWMIPEYNLDGGVTACVTSFAGINRNTEHPKEAFRVVDFLMSRQNQASSAVYSSALPVHMDLYSEDAPWHGRSMSEWNFGQFTQLREEINVVKFYTPLDSLVFEAWDLNAGDDELRELVHKAYVKMNMYLAES